MNYLTYPIECGTIRVSIPSIPPGTLSFLSNPSGADIYLIIGGIPTYTVLQTPNSIDLYPESYPESYDYILKLTGFEDYTGTAVVYSNETTVIDVDLVPKVTTTTTPTLAIASLSMLGLLLITSTSRAIPITTGILGGKVVAVQL